jgi:hypothetical protein
MLTLDLTNAPRWHDLAPGVRVQLRPLTTALMVATRSDPTVEAVPDDTPEEDSDQTPDADPAVISDEERAMVLPRRSRAARCWPGRAWATRPAPP